MFLKQFKEIAKYAMLRGGILAAMAAITFLYPSFLADGMVYIIAAYSILNGILGSMRYVAMKGKEENNLLILQLFISSASILLGVFCIIYFRYAVGILPVFLGIMLIVEGVVHFIASFNVKGKLRPFMMLLSIFSAAGGMVLIIFSFGFGDIKELSQIFGSLLILSCIEELLIHLHNQQMTKSKGGATK